LSLQSPHSWVWRRKKTCWYFPGSRHMFKENMIERRGVVAFKAWLYCIQPASSTLEPLALAMLLLPCLRAGSGGIPFGACTVQLCTYQRAQFCFCCFLPTVPLLGRDRVLGEGAQLTWESTSLTAEGSQNSKYHLASFLGLFQQSTFDWQRHLAAKNTLLTKCSLFQLQLKRLQSRM
jgi:hypothetical protein